MLEDCSIKGDIHNVQAALEVHCVVQTDHADLEAKDLAGAATPAKKAEETVAVDMVAKVALKENCPLRHVCGRAVRRAVVDALGSLPNGTVPWMVF